MEREKSYLNKILGDYELNNIEIAKSVERIRTDHAETFEKALAAIQADENLRLEDATLMLNCIIFALWRPFSS